MTNKRKHWGNPDIFPVPAWVRAVMAAVWISAIVLFWIHRDRFTVDGVVRLSPDSRILAVLILLGLFALKSLSIVMYCGILYAASGLLFPLPMAVVVNMAGTVIMASIPYLFGRKLGAPALVKLRERYPKLAYIQGLHRNNDFFYTLLLRSLHVLPLDIVSLYLGAAGTRYGAYLPGSVAGMLPSCILFPVLGMNITDPSSPPFLIAAAIEAVVTAGAFVGFEIIRRRHT
jgi:uncharacterized membrane protein YdjX (TVP38/TMEM64 family)